MAGLLDFIGTPEGQGLLSAAFGGLAGARSGQPLNSLGRTGLAGLSGYTDAIDRQNTMAQMAQRNQLGALQLKQAQQAQNDRDAERALAAQSFRTPDQLAMAANGGPTNAAAAAVPTTAPGFDWNAYSNGLAKIDPRGALALQASLLSSQPKFSTAPQYDQSGRAFLVNEKGGIKYLDGVASRDKIISENNGGTRTFRTEYSAAPVASQAITASADAVLGSNTTKRGQNMTADTAANRLSFDRENIGGVEYKTDGNGDTFAVPTKPKGSGPIQPTPVNMPNKNVKAANDALAIITEAKALIPDATGSYLGAGVDQTARVFGVSTGGAQSTAKLKALEGALMLKQPRMEGPQSDKDAALYRQMAGQIGDPTVPNETKLAALDAIQAMHEHYAGMQRKLPSLPQPKPGSTIRYDANGMMVVE